MLVIIILKTVSQNIFRLWEIKKKIIIQRSDALRTFEKGYHFHDIASDKKKITG